MTPSTSTAAAPHLRSSPAAGWPLAAAMGAVLLALAPAPASGFEWNAVLGTDYSRQDVVADTFSATTPRLALRLGLDAQGSIGGRGIFDWNGDGSYSRIRSDTDGTNTDARDAFRYSLATRLFSNDTSPLTLRLRLARTDERRETSLRPGVVGNYVGDDASFAGTYTLTPLTSVVFGYSRSALKLEEPGSLTREQKRQGISGAVTHAAGPFTFILDYSGELADGTFVADQYQSYNVRAGGYVELPAGYRLNVIDTYYVRKATADSASAYSLDIHQFDSFVRGDATKYGDAQQFGYRYSRSVAETFAETFASVAQSLRYTRDLALRNPAWVVHTSAVLSMSDTRRGEVSERGSGETLAAQFGWRRIREGATDDLRAGPQVALLQMVGREDAIGYGALAGASSSRVLGIYSLTGAYDFQYGSNVMGARGWNLTQTLSGSVARPLGRSSVSGQLLASSTRVSSPSLGSGATRRIYAGGTWRSENVRVQVSGSLESGLSALASRDLMGDGLFIPARFDQHAATAAAGVEASLPYNLTARGGVNLLSSRSPDQPVRNVTQTFAGLAYSFGALSVTIEDRYTTSDFGGGAYTNVVMASLQRFIGTRR